MISGQRIFLRPAVSADAPTVMRWENDPELWPVSETPGPFSLNDIQGFISESSDLFTQGQLRLIICLKKDAMAVGAVDIFNFNSLQKMAGIGIVLGEKEFRNKGIASEAIRILQEFVERDLGMRQLECLIYPDNIFSIQLFEKCHFIPSGVTYFKNKKAIRYTYTIEP